jgi:putative heme iron utilization protein
VFLAAQPGASYYVDFKDFSFYRLEPAGIRYVGGFGRMSWVDPEAYSRAEADPLADAELGIVSHMNGDHADAVLAYATALAGIEGATAAVMTAVDRYGFEIRAVTPAGPRAARVGFEEPVASSDEVRRAMIGLLKTARASGG